MPDQSKQPNNSKVVHLEPENQRLVRIKLSSLPPLAQAVHEKGKALAFKLLRDFFDRADDALFELADKAQTNQEQNLYFDAMREVRIQRRSIEKGFSEAIDTAFADLVVLDRPAKAVQQDDINVVVDDQLDNFVSVDSSVARANRDFAESIQLLCTRLDGLFSHPLNPKNFPLAPQLVCQAFLAEEKKLNVGIKSKLVLFKLFEKAVVNKLGEVYAPLNAFLKTQNLPSAKRAPATPEPDPAPVVNLELSAEVISMLNELAHEHHAVANPARHAPSDPAAQAEAAMDHPAELDVRSAIEAWQKQIGRPPASQIDDQVMSLVEMLFEFVLDGQPLAPPMHALISRMRVPIVKAAILDKTFFTKDGHIARKLLNEMTTAALAWEGDERSCQDDPLFLRLRTIVQRINDEFVLDPAVFAEALAEFSDFLDAEKKRSAVLEQRTIDAEGGKARAEVARTTVALEIELRTKGKTLPEVVSTLINEAWSKVLFVSVLKHGYDSPEWQANLHVLEDLIWSVTPPADSAERQKLIRLVPNLLRQLRFGLDSISWNPFDMSDIFKALEKIHLGCLRGKFDQPGASDAAAASAAAEKTPAAVQADLEKIDADLAQHKAAEPDLRTSAESLPPDDPFMQQVESFVQGAWFEMVDEKGAALRCRLAVYIKPTGKYIFVNRSGMKIAEKSQSELALALKNKQLRALDNSMLFDRALEAIVTSLRKN